ERRHEGAGGEAHHRAERDVEVPERRRLAREDDSEAEQESAREGHEAAAEAVGHRAPAERAGAHGNPVDHRRRRDGATTPAHRLFERLEEHSEREERSPAGGGDRGRGGRPLPSGRRAPVDRWGLPTIACTAMWPLAWPAVALVAATLFALLLRGLLLSVLGRDSDSPNGWSSLAQSIRVPSILWSAVFGLWGAIVVANETERLSSRLSQPASIVLEIAVILSVTITIANVLSTLMQRVSERKALGRPMAGLGQSVARGVVYCVGLLVLLAALGIQITPI